MHCSVMEMRRTWLDRVGQRSRDEGSAVQEWVRGSLRESYEGVLRERLPQELLDLLPKE